MRKKSEVTSPTTVEEYLERGKAHRDAGNYDLAIADFDEAIRLDPNDAEAYIHRANAYRLKDEHGLAIADYDEALRLDPNLVAAHSNRAKAYAMKGEYYKMVENYAAVLRLDPDHADTWTIVKRLYQYGEIAMYKKVPMPENWESGISDEKLAKMESEGGTREFWEFKDGN